MEEGSGVRENVTDDKEWKKLKMGWTERRDDKWKEKEKSDESLEKHLWKEGEEEER